MQHPGAPSGTPLAHPGGGARAASPTLVNGNGKVGLKNLRRSRRVKVRIDKPSPEVVKIFKEDNNTLIYNELVMIPIDPYELE